MNNNRYEIAKSKEGYIAPNGMAITPTEEWLESHGFHFNKVPGWYFLNWPMMSYVRDSANCLRIEPGKEGVWIVGLGEEAVLLHGCWPPERVIELWKVITGDVLK
jgi:hypothetical protein